MELKPQDIVVALKLFTSTEDKLSMQKLGTLLGLSSSRIHESIHRLERANLAKRLGAGRYRPNTANLIEFITHGLKYAFMPEIGEYTRGIPTAADAPPLKAELPDGTEPPYVWPDAQGTVQGIAFSPLHRCVPKAIQQDPRLYALLAMIDAIRGGRLRDRRMATERIGQWLSA